MDFDALHISQWLRDRNRIYAPFSNKYGAFCVVDTKEVYDPDREVTDLLPVVAIFDLIKDEAPSIQDAINSPFIKFYDYNQAWGDPPKYDCTPCYIPSKVTLDFCNIQQMGTVEQFVEIKDELNCYESCCRVSDLEIFLLDARLRRYG